MSRRIIPLLMKRSLGIIGGGRKRIIFQIILVALAVSALVFALTFVTSMSDAIANKYALLGSGHLQIHQEEITSSLPYETYRVGTTYGLLYSKDTTSQVFLKGVGADYFTGKRGKEVTILQEHKESTTLMRVSISKTLAEVLGVAAGENLALMVGGEHSVRPTLVRVEQIYESGYRELDEQLVFTDRAALQKLAGGSISLHYEVLSEVDQIQAIKEDLLNKGYLVTTWSEEAPQIASNLATSKEATFVIIGVIAILLGYGISELARQIVEDDKRQIIILMLLGSKKQTLLFSYLFSVLIVTAIALFLGIGLGILFSYGLPNVLPLLDQSTFSVLSYYLLSFTILIPIKNILLIATLVLLSSVLATALSLHRGLRHQRISSLTFD